MDAAECVVDGRGDDGVDAGEGCVEDREADPVDNLSTKAVVL